MKNKYHIGFHAKWLISFALRVGISWIFHFTFGLLISHFFYQSQCIRRNIFKRDFLCNIVQRTKTEKKSSKRVRGKQNEFSYECSKNARRKCIFYKIIVKKKKEIVYEIMKKEGKMWINISRYILHLSHITSFPYFTHNFSFLFILPLLSLYLFSVNFVGYL